MRNIWRMALIVAVLLAAALVSKPPMSMKGLTLLTRDGCVNTAQMRENLDDALKGLHWAVDYRVVNIGELPASDARTGYPTPTLLWKGKDLFGLSVPVPPYAKPT